MDTQPTAATDGAPANGVPAPSTTTPTPHAPATRRADPLSTERTQLLAARTALDRERAQLHDREWQNFDNSVTASIENSLRQDITEALAPLKDQYPPATMKALVNDRRVEIHEMLQRDPEFRSKMQIAAERARASMSRQDHDALVTAYRQAARNLIRQQRQSFLRDAGVATLKKSEERHQKLSAAAAQTSVAAASGAVSPPEAARVPKKPYEDSIMTRARQIAADMAATVGA